MNELEQNYLEHHGILGQKWGIRRYQNHDGSLTDAGRKRYGIEGERTAKQTQRRLNDLDQAMAYNVHAHNQADIRLSKLSNKAKRKAAKGKELSERDIKKAEKAAKKMAEADAYLKEGAEETRRILENLPDTMSFTERSVMRTATKGLDWFKDAPQDFNSPWFGTIKGLAPVPTMVSGREYKVKNKSKKQLAKEATYKQKMDQIQEAYEIADKKQKEYLKKHPDAVEGEDYDFTDFYADAQDELEKKYKR